MSIDRSFIDYLNSLSADEVKAMTEKIQNEMRPFVRAFIRVFGVTSDMYNPFLMIHLKDLIVKPGMSQDQIELELLRYKHLHEQLQRGKDDKPTTH